MDLARGHVCAIKKLETNCGLFICNLGTGKGYSVLDVIHASVSYTHLLNVENVEEVGITTDTSMAGLDISQLGLPTAITDILNLSLIHI